MNGISTDNFPFAMPILARARWHDAICCNLADCIFVFLGVPPCRHRRTNSTPWSGNIRVIPHFTVPQNGEMIGISTVRFPFAMPILTSFGGMTYSILGAQPAENVTMRMPLRASARRGCGPRSPADCNINVRQPNPRQKRFREKGGRGDGALRIGERFR